MLADAKTRTDRPLTAPPSAHADSETVIDARFIEGRLKASSVKTVGEIVEKHPDKTLSIVRNWLHQGE